MRVLTRIVAIVLLVLGPSALAWGPNGHAIVADIAEAHLTTNAAQQVKQLLALEGKSSLDQIASWADDYRPTHPETGPWHFVDIPLQAAGFDESRDCAGGNCVVDKIVTFAELLKNPSASDAERLQALKFVVHFVGDVHQPLHCEDDNDKGGNGVKITFYGRSTNFHAIWDEGIIEEATGLRTPMPGYRIEPVAVRAEAETLDKTVTASEAAHWASPGMLSHLPETVIAWANESHGLAQAAYKAKGDDTHLGDTYEKEEWPVVEIQLERAGIRLAELLNELLP